MAIIHWSEHPRCCFESNWIALSVSSSPLASSRVHAWGQRECDTAGAALLCGNLPTIISFAQQPLKQLYTSGSPFPSLRQPAHSNGACKRRQLHRVLMVISCSLGGHSEYFGWKDGVNIAVSSQNGPERLPETWVTLHELHRDVFIYLFIHLFKTSECHRVNPEVHGCVGVHWAEFFLSMKLKNASVDCGE